MGFVDQDASFSNFKVQHTTSLNKLSSCDGHFETLTTGILSAEDATITNLTVLNPVATAINALVPLQGDGTTGNPLVLSLPFVQLGDKTQNLQAFYSAVPQNQYPAGATYSSQFDLSGLINPVPFVTIIVPGVYRIHVDTGVGATGLTAFAPPYSVSVEGDLVLNGGFPITICRWFYNVPVTNSADVIIESISGDMFLALTTGDQVSIVFNNVSTSPAVANNVFLFNPSANLEFVHSP